MFLWLGLKFDNLRLQMVELIIFQKCLNLECMKFVKPTTVEVFNEGIFVNLYIHNLPNTCHVGFLQELEFYSSLNTFNTKYCEITFIRGVPIFVGRLIHGIKNPTNNETWEAARHRYIGKCCPRVTLSFWTSCCIGYN